MKTLNELTNKQLEAQRTILNSARFLMEKNYNASETTINELMDALKKIDSEINLRNSHKVDSMYV